MRIWHLSTLAACVSIAGLAIFGGLHVATAATLARADLPSFQCQAMPAPTASSTATPTAAASTPAPAQLCVSVLAAQDSFQAGTAATWTVTIWADNGPVTGVTVTLALNYAGQPVFSDGCPGGNGNGSCGVGGLAASGTPSSYSMQAQFALPANAAAGTSVILTAIASAGTPMPALPAAAASVSVTAPPAPTSSPTPTASATPTATPTPTPTASAAKTATSAPAPQTPAATTPPVTLPVIGSIPTSLITPDVAQTATTGVVGPGSITGLPVITPAADATSPAAGLVPSAVADNLNSPSANAGSFVLVMSAATARIIGIVILGILMAIAVRLLLTSKRFAPARPGRTRPERAASPERASRLKFRALRHPRPQPAESPDPAS